MKLSIAAYIYIDIFFGEEEIVKKLTLYNSGMYLLFGLQAVWCISALEWVWISITLLIVFNFYVLPAGKVLSCHAAYMTADYYVHVGCFTSGVINSAQILICLKLCVHAVQLIGSQVQSWLQVPPAEWRGIDWYVEMA